jgi:phage/plasmid-associated DNA primase
MSLKGKRVAWVDEFPEGRLDRQLATTLCGGAPIVGRALYGNVEEFEPTHSMFINTNHLPGMDNDPALLRRIVALPFDAEFRTVDHSDPEMRYDENNPKHFLRDNDLTDKIPYEAFLTWVVQGSVKYLEAGKLPERPECCAVKSAEVKEDNDRLQDFIEERCLIDKDHQVPCHKFLEKYRKWRSFSGIRKKDVHAAMTKKGFKMFKDRVATSLDEHKTVYSGIDLIERHEVKPWPPGMWGQG